MTKQHRTFSIYGNSGGCPQNQLDGAHVYNYLTSNGYAYTDSLESADVIIINSCAYKREKEDLSFDKYSAISRIAKKEAKIIFSGCLPKIAPDRLRDMDAKVTIIPGTELNKIEATILPEHSSWSESEPNSIPAPVLTYVKPFRRFVSSGLTTCRKFLPYDAARHFDRLFMYDHAPDTFLIRVAQGCLGQCTYCAIRFSRGRLKSQPLDSILSEVQKAVDKEVNEILLSATDLAAYGRDLGIDVSVLLHRILIMAKRQYLLLFYANPRWMIDIWNKLESAFASQRIHFVHLSLNGGSEHVLKNMKRGYSLGDFETLVRSIKRVSPSTILQTQIITGFPGETQEDFNETVHFLKRNYFHNVQIHAFDPRPGTEAASMDEQVPMEVRQQRRRLLYRITLWAKLKYDVRYASTGFNPVTGIG